MVFVLILIASYLCGYVSGSISTPSETIYNKEEQNPEFIILRTNDRLVLSFITANLIQVILVQNVGLSTANQFLNCLLMFHEWSQTRFYLLQKWNLSITDYILFILDNFCDNVHLIDSYLGHHRQLNFRSATKLCLFSLRLLLSITSNRNIGCTRNDPSHFLLLFLLLYKSFLFQCDWKKFPLASSWNCINIVLLQNGNLTVCDVLLQYIMFLSC